MNYEMIRERAGQLESLGYGGLWLVDHMFAKGLPDVDFLEGWTLLSALAEATKDLRLGVMVTCNSYRNPGLLAKMAATVDQISGGRLELGIGAGWMEEEYVAYGYDFPPVGTRLAQLGESLEIITRLCSDPRTSYDGRHYSFNDAPFEPKPAQKPLPITIGGAGEKVLLALVARYAARWNCPMTSAHEIGRLREVLRGHCEDAGRDFEEITVSEQTAVIIGRDADDLAAKLGLAKMMIGGWVDIKRMAVIGTPEQVADGLQAKIDSGVTDFALVFGDMGMPDTLELFAEGVVPRLTSG
jgi:F420-dependent oxidoreductase-like protein